MARQQRRGLALGALLLGCSLLLADAFYLPGVAPQDFKKKDVMFLKVNKLSSIKNQLPYEYYSLPYCRPEKIVQSAENLGEVLRGDRIENSLYQVGAWCSRGAPRVGRKVEQLNSLSSQIQMRVDEQCKVLCRIESLSGAQANAFRTKIEDDYRVNM
jgi:transmembrane 9 superfamily protein 2/4